MQKKYFLIFFYNLFYTHNSFKPMENTVILTSKVINQNNQLVKKFNESAIAFIYESMKTHKKIFIPWIITLDPFTIYFFFEIFDPLYSRNICSHLDW